MSNEKTQNAIDFLIIPAEEKHLNGMVKCRIKAFPDYFTTIIGPRFIKASCRFYTCNKDGIVYVAKTSLGQVVGLVSGGNPELRKEFSRKYLPRLIIDIIWSAIKNSSARKRLMQHATVFFEQILVKLKLVKPKKLDEPPEDLKGTWASLLTICTDPDFVGKGVGTALMKAFEKQCQIQGYKTIRLSVHNDNTPALGLYTKCGFKVVHRTSHGTYFKKNLENM